MRLCCKVGDMAEIIIGTHKGAIVEVVCQSETGSGPKPVGYGEFTWVIKTAWPLLSLRGPNVGCHVSKAWIPDRALRPILPPAEPETVTNEESISV